MEFLEFDDIWTASEDGNLSLVKRLVRQGVDINMQDEVGYSAM
jgi:hypothetical protein